jgi:hypothetical protein
MRKFVLPKLQMYVCKFNLGLYLVLTAYVAVGVSMQCVVSLALKSEDSTIKWQYTVCHGCLISD